MNTLGHANVVYNVSENYHAIPATIVQHDAAEAATASPASLGYLLSVDYPIAAVEAVMTTTSTAVAPADYAVKNISVALCHPSTDIPSVDEYFTGKLFLRKLSIYTLYNSQCVVYICSSWT